MAEGPLHNVSFQAAKTNSSPPPSVLPYHIEQALHGEVGTIRPPFELSRISRFLGLFVTFLVFFGILWVLRQTPIVALILATTIAGISLSMSGLFFGIPYLRQRRSEWTAANWWLLNTSIFIVWVAGLGVLQQLVYNPPKIAWKSMLSLLMDNTRRIEEIKSQLWTARYDCNYRGCAEWRHELEGKLAKAQAPQSEWIGEGETVDENLIFVALGVAFGVAVGIAAHGKSFASETTNAIWREPHTGYPGAVSLPPVAAPEDSTAKLKKKGFDHWLKNNISLSGDTPITVDAVYGDYRKFLDDPEKHITPPPAYNLSEFKIAFKSVTGKEVVEIKGIPSYQGVSIASGGLI